MRKQTRSSFGLATIQKLKVFETSKFQEQSRSAKRVKTYKRGNSAKGYSLLPLALRPRLLGTGIVVGAAIVTGINFSINSNSAFATTATLTIPDAVSVNVNPSVDNGFAESTPGAVNVSTSNLAGYTLSIKAKDSTNGNSLVNTSNNGVKLTSIATELSADQYKNGDYVNTWGFKPDYVDSSPNTSYRPGPDANGIVLAKTNSDSTLGNINLAIATKVNSDTVAGNYNNTFVLTAVPNEAKYNITYNLNGGSGGPGKATETGDIGSSTEIAINNTAPTAPSGKDFLGWCSKNPGEGDTCDGVLVQPGKSLYLCKCDLNITLYAMYGKHVSPFAGKMDGESCSSTGGYVGKVYGEICWMWQDYKVGYTKTWTWNNALTICPTGWHLPSQTEFQTLLDRIGSGAQLYQAGWTLNTYWSSTEYDSSDAYYLDVTSTSAYIVDIAIDAITKASDLYVRCVAG